MEDIGPDIVASLTQFYPIFLLMLLSINQQQLSLFDAQYALIISASPLMGYLVIASLCDFFRRKTKLYKRIRSHSHIICFFGALIPFLWVGLSITLVLSSTAFKDSKLCHDSTSKNWVIDFFKNVVYLTLSLPRTLTVSLYFLFIIMPFILCLAREVLQVVRDSRTCRRRKLTGLGLLRVSWCVPIVVGIRHEANIVKACCWSQPQVVYIPPVRVS